MYNKYAGFIQEVKKIRGLARLNIAYNPAMDSIYIYFTQAQWNKLDNEKGRTWERFSDLLSKYDFSHGFYCMYIEVYKED